MNSYIFQKLGLIALVILLVAVFAGAVLTGLSDPSAAQETNATTPNGSAPTAAPSGTIGETTTAPIDTSAAPTRSATATAAPTPTAAPTATTTPTATPNATDAQLGERVEDAAADAAAPSTDTPEPIAGSVGPIDVLDYELRDGTLTLTLRANDPVAFALSDSLAGLQQQGLSDVPMKKGTLSEGRRTLSLDVSVVDGAGAVTLSTPQAAVRIQTEAVSLSKEPVDYQTAQTLVAGSALFGAAGVYSWVKRKREDEDKQAERIL
jgi:hypothetical protein